MSNIIGRKVRFNKAEELLKSGHSLFGLTDFYCGVTNYFKLDEDLLFAFIDHFKGSGCDAHILLDPKEFNNGDQIDHEPGEYFVFDKDLLESKGQIETVNDFYKALQSMEEE